MYDFNDFKDIIKKLRSKDGCPWDREQTLQSLKKYVIEECYEVIDAVDKGSDQLQDELGDLFLQIMIMSEIESEQQRFNVDDVIDNVCEKMIRRHPHVFADVEVDGTAQVLNNWDKIKSKEKNHTSITDTLRDVPHTFPPTLRAEKVSARAAKVGFDFETVEQVIDKLYEEIAELKEAIKDGNCEEMQSEYGDVLFSAVNVGRFLKLSSIISLNQATEKFINRFEKVEQIATRKGLDMKNCTLEQLDQIWEQAKG